MSVQVYGRRCYDFSPQVLVMRHICLAANSCCSLFPQRSTADHQLFSVFLDVSSKEMGDKYAPMAHKISKNRAMVLAKKKHMPHGPCGRVTHGGTQ